MRDPQRATLGPDLEPPHSADILVVDDNESNLLAVEAALGELRHRLVKAHSGAEALRRLLDQDFALILLDVEMPGMNGFETARMVRARQRSSRVPIIFITAYGRDDQEVLAGYSLGAVDFLFKPIVPEVLRAKAGVFVELQQRTLELSRQGELLRAAERREHDRRMREARQRWEAEWLRRQMDDERRVAEEMAAKADELERTVGDLRRAEAALTRMNQELTEADRRKDEFLAVLAHELRNPLAPMMNALEIMRRAHGKESGERARSAMGRQVRHLVRLVDDLLEVSRITSGKIELRKRPVDLAEIVSQAVSTSQPLIDEREHAIVVDKGLEPLVVECDFVRLTQVVSNLLNNAARYTEPGGRLEVGWHREGDAAAVRVADNGRGIEAEALDRIFDLFYQQRCGGGGLGLGLTLVKRLVDLHGGTIEASSPGRNQGSAFVVRLPIALRPAEVETLDAIEHGPALRPRRVVLVEDNPDILDTTRALLAQWGHEVLAASDGSSGIELLLEARPDVAFVDLGLPDLDGYEIARRVRHEEQGGRMRLVALSGYGQKKNRERALEAGFDAHVVKPARADALRRELEGDTDAG